MHETTKRRVSEIRVSGCTDIGMRRARNEDAVLVVDLNTGNLTRDARSSAHEIGPHGTLLVLSDGVGGAAAGDVASEIAVTTISEALGSLPADLSGALRMRFAIEAANERIWKRTEASPQLRGMAATATAVLVHGGRATVAQVGDSRAYLLRGDLMQQLTKDQSLAQMLVDTGAVKPEEMPSIRRNVILQALGAKRTIEPTMSSVELREDDYLLVCSDGLWDKVSAIEMRQVLEQAADQASACQRLIKMANERGGEDNITIIVAQVNASSPGEAILHSINPYVEQYQSGDQQSAAA